MTNDIEQKLWNIDLVVADIKEFPQTYDTILKEHIKNGTYQFVLRRKLNNLLKLGMIQKTNIPGTRFGKVIYYHNEKKYNILIEGGRAGSDVYYFFDYEKMSRYYIKLKDFWFLNNGRWEKNKEDKIIFEGNVLKFL